MGEEKGFDTVSKRGFLPQNGAEQVTESKNVSTLKRNPLTPHFALSIIKQRALPHCSEAGPAERFVRKGGRFFQVFPPAVQGPPPFVRIKPAGCLQ